MRKRFLLPLLFSCSVALAADQTPSEASLKEILTVTNTRALIDSTLAQMDGVMTSTMQQATQGQPVSPDMQREIDRVRVEFMSFMKEQLDWEKLEPLYIRVYQQTFTQAEVDGMLAFYKTPVGAALIGKMPLVVQKTMSEMQQQMAPALQRLQQKQQEIIAKIAAEKAKTS